MIDRTNEGRRVRLISTDDPYTGLRPGDEGTFQFAMTSNFGVGQSTSTSIAWDNGSRLALLETDRYEFI